ncbi:predicted protein [Sclerotinia sclerotiorum 1980 UF-70]|uniref:Uncharacterized protein n=1 Tax=Sclerotinia sclerotiorum (strain ATCC 18683 / 1980 / Ss-1) TaxID=665079 RepID=A7EAG6_SCLS1|nr:predicted protein [Sclerotinia sclerotiorum 1980 UF-70]EDN99444.1 predicted protein [Sclerotinia sclerotiorum 1980 UF-70]
MHLWLDYESITPLILLDYLYKKAPTIDGSSPVASGLLLTDETYEDNNFA